MFDGLLGLHSILRYVLLVLLISAIIKAVLGWLKKGDYKKGHNQISLFTMAIAHIQLFLGLSLYFMSGFVKSAHENMSKAMKNTELRFWAVEHISLMIFSVALITIGRHFAKNANEDTAKHRKTAIFFILALIVIMVAIPWPFTEVARNYFYSGQ